MNLFIKIITVFFPLILINCGFKVSNKTTYNNFYVQNIETNSSGRIDFKIRQGIKNKLSNDKASQKILLKINNEKNKNISEKNSKNQISKYEIVLNTKINVIFIAKNREEIVKVTSKGTYSIADAHLNTKKNQENLENFLIEKNIEKFLINLQKLKNDN